MEEKSKWKKVLGIIGNVLLYLFLALCVVAIIVTILAKRSDDGAVNVFGYEMRTVLSGSMEKSEMTDVSEYAIKDIPVRSLVVTERVPEKDEDALAWYAKLKVGDVLTFRYLIAGRQETITHRVIGIEPSGEGYKITLRGDNRTENEGEQVIYTYDDASPNYVLGKVVFVGVVLGNIIYILQQPIGIAFVVIVPAAIIIILQVIRIVNVIAAEKRKKVEEREAEKSEEIEELKKRLAEMEKRQSEGEGTMPEPSPSETPIESGSNGESPAVETVKEE